ncbi:arginine--tRNA ligase [Myceligenerans pegani]|uniref:Arginine--tRNA ligase n=1 Tax=Myceligenerans pegani TaxID=2776917 RepID=A0ABR9MZ74_9MICO|nr:arginine--tRNA ligase [Myceligenerans sp. TRM 65318]MBE1876158.1 arginine--tRNA ligase [Myceligenerans sp. TRM 65318]MBE3018429.1 arginine--tRNA ligase [Myceligenerans sp. TRM 65318]
MTPTELSGALSAALAAAVADGTLQLPADAIPASVHVERPRQREHGDWATNVALQLAKKAGTTPRALAEDLAARLGEHAGIKSVDVAGPGFLNITLDAGAAGELARTVVEAGREYGRTDTLAGQVIDLEYISANPTGPLHIGHTRWAALGDAMARILRAAGADVTAEYYINDAGAQMDRFGASILARATGGEIPEGGYHGEYVKELADKVLERRPDLPDLPEDEAIAVAREEGYQLQLAEIREVLENFGVHFDVWFSERELHDSGAVERAVARLREQGHVFDSDGAVWLRTTDFTDDKDRVLIRANGEPTYFAADAAYYLSKKDRGFPGKIYLLGADHHGYINRLKAIAACAGDDPQRNIEVLIGQLVNVGGAKLSKRAGNIIELRDLVEWIGRDAVRYSLSRYPADTPLELQGEDMLKQTNDNPVFYVQYAHSRTCAVDRNAAERGVRLEDAFDPSLLNHESESALLGRLTEYPRIVAQAAELREPHRVARYLEALAGDYHSWYNDDAKLRANPYPDEAVTDAHRTRLWLNDAVRTVLANGLDLLGVSAPERM